METDARDGQIAGHELSAAAAVAAGARSNSCLLVERKRLIKDETLIIWGPCVFVSQPTLTTMRHNPVQQWVHLIIAVLPPLYMSHRVELLHSRSLAEFIRSPQLMICQHWKYIFPGGCNVMPWFFWQSNQFIQQGLIWWQRWGSFSAWGAALSHSTRSHL